MPLTFASNIFVPLSSLPGWLRAVVSNNPVTHLASAARALTDGEPVGADLWWVLGTSALIVLVFAPIAMAMYRKER
jgi:ABC-2 type transport system permease protein